MGKNKACNHSGEVIWPTLSGISQLKLSTLPSKILTNRSSLVELTRRTSGVTLPETWLLVVRLEQPVYVLSTHSILPVLVLLLMLEVEMPVNSLVLVTASQLSPKEMVLEVSTKVSLCPSKVSLSTELPTLVLTIL